VNDVRFLKAKAYLDGVSRPPRDIWLNVDHIVSFHESTVRFDGVKETPVVYLDTTRCSGYIIEMTGNELAEAMELIFAAT
jgi:hypothetical protein